MSHSKIALVTGASSGIGEATARALLADGWQVWAAARREDRMQHLGRAGARVVSLDLTDPASVDAVAAQLSQAGGCDLLINAAGYAAYGSVEETSREIAQRQLDVNLMGPSFLIGLVLPGMRERGRGRIINVSSFGGRVAFPLGGWYHASKFGLEGLSDSLRLEVAPFGIDVVVVQPGSVQTEWVTHMRDSLLAASGDGPYRSLAESVQRLVETSFGKKGIAVEPDVIARTIARAASVSRPKPRYAVPAHSRLFLLMRWALPDRLFDRVFRWQLKYPALARRPW